MKTPSFWQYNGLTSALLTPLSWLYALGAALDRSLTTAQRAPLPVISIGNVTAGGAGKTPTALALAPLLEEIGATYLSTAETSLTDASLKHGPLPAPVSRVSRGVSWCSGIKPAQNTALSSGREGSVLLLSLKRSRRRKWAAIGF